MKVVPSLPAHSFDELAVLAEAVVGDVAELQVDIVDGKFVDAYSWPFTESDPISELHKVKGLTHDFVIEMDCMVLEPEQYLDLFVELGVSRVIVHMRSTEAYEDIIVHARQHGYKIGIAFTNDVPYEEYAALIPSIDFVQVMGIAVVGAQGQPFDERTLETVARLRSQYPDLEIAVDGSVNKDTIVSLKEAGVTRFAPGSAIAKQSDPKAAYHHLCSLIA